LRRWRWLCAAALLGIALPACEEPTEVAPPPAAPVAVRVTPVRRGEISSILTASGETAALTTLRLASPVAGRVTMLVVHPGDRVGAGTVAARVLPLENEATLHGLNVLSDAGALGGEAQLARRLAGEMRDVPLRAPFDAVVAGRLHNPGEQVAPGDPLLELFDPRSLVVIAQVPVQSSAEIRPGLAVELTAGGTQTTGRVAAVESAVNPQALTVPVRVALDGPLQPPLLHAAAIARITLARHPDVLLVPPEALLSSTVEARGVVMVVADGIARRREVVLGVRTPAAVEVIGGLAEGEQVIREGGFGLPDGTAVAAQPSADEPGERAQR
jgi:multidrug efflux pump subunit AcrA (membrane-fusion protein)